MDPTATDYEDDSNIKVEVKEEPEYIYVDESVCRVKLEERDDDVILPKDEEEVEKVVADVGLFAIQPVTFRIVPARSRSRRRRKPKSSTIGPTRKILPRPQIQVSNLNITSAPLPISHLQPTPQCPPKQLPEPVPEQQSSGTQNISLSTAALPQVTANTAGIGRKILPRPHNATPLIRAQSQAVSLQQLHSVNTSTAHQTIPLNQIQSISPASNCNIMPIHQLQSPLTNTNHAALSVPQLKSTGSGHSQKTIVITPQKSAAATINKPVPIPQLKSVPAVSNSLTISTPLVHSTSSDGTNIGQIPQKQLTHSSHGRKLLPRPQQPPIRPSSGMVIHPQQQSLSLQHLQSITPVSMHQTVPLQQVQSISTSSSQQTLNIHQMQNISSVSTSQNIPVQQIQTLNTGNSQQNVALHSLQNGASVTTHQSLSLQPLPAIPSVSSHQHLPVQQFQTLQSGNSHQTMPIQQIHALPSGNSQQSTSVHQVPTVPSGNSQTIPVHQVSTIPSANSQQTIPVHQVSTIPSGNSQQTIPVHQVSTIPAANPQQAIHVHQVSGIQSGNPQRHMPLHPLQTLTSGSSQQNMHLQNLQTITTRSSPQNISVQQLQTVSPGNSHQILPMQQIQAIPSVNNCQVTPIQQVQSITAGSTEQAVSLQQLRTIVPVSQQQTGSLQQMQTIQPACPQQGISLQQLQSMSPASAQQILPIQQYNNSHSSVPLQQIQTLPHGSNQQAVPLHQLKSVNPGISQHASSLQQLQSIPQAGGHQNLSIQQLQTVNQSNVQTNLPLQQLQTSLPSATTHQTPLQYIQPVTSTANQNMPLHQQLQSIHHNDSSQSMEFQSIASSSQNQAAVHIQQQMQLAPPMHCIAQGKTQLKMPIQPIKTNNTVAKNKLRKLRQNSGSHSTFKNRPILKVGSVTSYAVEHNIKLCEKKIFIPRSSDKASSVPLYATAPTPGRKILPRPLLPTTSSNSDIQAIRLENLKHITSTANYKILPKKPLQSVDISVQNSMSIPELQATTSSLTHKTIPIQQLQSSSHQTAISGVDGKNMISQIPLSSANAACNYVPFCGQKSDTSVSNIYIEIGTQLSGKLLTSSKHFSLISPKTETGPETQFESSSLSESGSPTEDINELSPVVEQDSTSPDTISERITSPQNDTATIYDCSKDSSYSQLEVATPRTLAVPQETSDQSSSIATQQNYNKMIMNESSKSQIHLQPSSAASNEPCVSSQEQCSSYSFPDDCASEGKSKEHLSSSGEQIETNTTLNSVHNDQFSSSVVSSTYHHHPQEHASLDRDDSSSIVEDEGDSSANESKDTLQEECNNSLAASACSLQLEDKPCHGSNVGFVSEHHFESRDTTDDSVSSMQQRCLTSDVSRELGSSHSDPYYSAPANYASSSKPLYSTAANGVGSLSTHSQGHSIPCIIDKSQTSPQDRYTLLKASDISVPVQPVSSVLYSNTNVPVNYDSAAEVKSELGEQYAVKCTTENAVPSHELQYTVPCTTNPTLSYLTQDQFSSPENLSLVQEQCSSSGSEKHTLPVSHLHILSTSEHNLPFQHITSTTYSTTCSYNPAPEAEGSNNSYWINTRKSQHPKAMDEVSFSYPQSENSEVEEERLNVSVGHHLQDTLQVCQDEFKKQEGKSLEEESCQEDLLGSQKCLHSGYESHSLSYLKKYYTQKKRRELIKICKLKTTVMSQKNTIRTLWKKLRFERKRNVMLCEELAKSRSAEGTDNFEDSKFNGVDKKVRLSSNKESTRLMRKRSNTCETLSLSNKRRYAEKMKDLLNREYTDTYISKNIGNGKRTHSTLIGSTSSCTSESELRCLIQEFMMRDDVSQVSSKKTSLFGETSPLRYRLHYLTVLHKRFMADCFKGCSFKTFCNYIPCNVLKCKAEEIDSCLCITCQNPELKIESMVKRRLLSITTDIEEIINDEGAYELFISNLKSLRSRNALLTYSVWTVDACGNGPPIPQKRTVTHPLSEVTSLLENELHSLMDHMKRTYQQYEAAYEAKCEADYSLYHAVIQTDWAPLIILHSVGENGIPEPQRVISLQCGYMWSKTESTGFVALSDSRDRTSAAVCASLDKVLNKLINYGMKTIFFFNTSAISHQDVCREIVALTWCTGFEDDVVDLLEFRDELLISES
ncbi:mucin-4-like [Cherax quadricarinatus]|uniref:mucin-4-like n=1 Tax=Cherax quadricarinatus TaxID=27406 RepID=UPI00387E4E77